MIRAERKAEKEVEGSKMEIRLLNKDKKNAKVSFLLKGVMPSFANSLRRSIIAEVPTMAIEDVEFRKNSSVLYDEIVAHRLGLLPLKTDLETYDMPDKCGCSKAGCAKCQVKMTLKAKGPCMVLASEIESKDPKIVPAFPNMPIVKLLKGQELEFEATAILGRGKDHVKWSPGLAYYKYRPVVEIVKQPENAEEIAKKCPVDVFEFKNKKLTIDKDNLMKCHLCGECAELSNGEIKINETSEDFIFEIESFGQLSCDEMVTKALDELGSDVEEFINLLKK